MKFKATRKFSLPQQLILELTSASRQPNGIHELAAEASRGLQLEVTDEVHSHLRVFAASVADIGNDSISVSTSMSQRISCRGFKRSNRWKPPMKFIATWEFSLPQQLRTEPTSDSLQPTGAQELAAEASQGSHS